MYSLLSFPFRGFGTLPNKQFSTDAPQRGRGKYGSGYPLPMLATNVFIPYALLRSYARFCQPSAKEKRCNPQKKITSSRPYYLPLKLWQHLIGICNIRSGIRWSEIGSKSFNKLTEQILNDTHRINGKSRHRNEFVTCGGISLSNISINTLESKSLPGIYFAGEVLDVDAITGGFNLQAAWSMAYVAAKSLSREL